MILDNDLINDFEELDDVPYTSCNTNNIEGSVASNTLTIYFYEKDDFTCPENFTLLIDYNVKFQ